MKPYNYCSTIIYMERQGIVGTRVTSTDSRREDDSWNPRKHFFLRLPEKKNNSESQPY